MLKIHQPYKSKYVFAFVSIGVLLLGSLMIINSSSGSSVVYAAGDSRTIHDISDMQDMTQQICSNTDIGDTEILIDRRGTNIPYKVIKMLDGTCWMAENLRLINAKLTKYDSDITSEDGFTIPISSTSNFGYSMSKTDGLAPHAYYDNDTTYGAYYNWYTATAGSGDSSIDGSNGKDIANSSICPKGWKLPAYDGAGSFYNIINGNGTVNTGYQSSWTVLNGKNGYMFGCNSNDAFFPAAGLVAYGSLGGASTSGIYWSRRAYSLGDDAYFLTFSSDAVRPQDANNRYYGYSVRCVALGGLDKIEKPMWEESKDGNVNVTMPTVIIIDAASGMQGTAEVNKITEGTIIAKVTSNGEHEVLLSAVEPSLKDPKVTTAEISPVSSTNPVQPGNNAWGIWNNTTKIYDPITKESKTYDETIADGVDSQKIHTYQVGISISPALPAGTYATEVTVTAAAK